MWDLLLEHLDFHHRKWYHHHEEGWAQISISDVFKLLNHLAPGQDHNKIIKQFMYRDRETHCYEGRYV